MSNLIHGINPSVISYVSWRKGFRIGRHPLYFRLKNKGKWSIFHEHESFEELWYPPVFRIYGSNGRCIASATCKSNKEAKALYDIAKKQLELSCSTGF